MPFDLVTEPIASPGAFGQEGDTATQSAAAILLALGMQIRRDDQGLMARALTFTGRTVEPAVVPLPEEDVDRLAIPFIQTTGERVHPAQARVRLAQAGVDADHQAELPRELIQESAQNLENEPTQQSAAMLFEACLRHPAELVRVAAASAYLDVTTDPQAPLAVLRQAVASDDDETREVAAISLANYAPGDAALQNAFGQDEPPGAGAPANTWIFVHGTKILRLSPWWQPGSTFHQYFVDEVRPDVYSASDCFRWGGGYSDAARATAAVQLFGWARAHPKLTDIEIVAHSHGGNVAMLATHGGFDLGELVLLSCPVHLPKYLPDFTCVPKIVSVRVHMDIALLADRAGQRFRLPQIDEHVLPIWFKHGATHDPDVWRTYDIRQWL